MENYRAVLKPNILSNLSGDRVKPSMVQIYLVFLETAANVAVERLSSAAKACSRFNDNGSTQTSSYVQLAEERVWKTLFTVYADSLEALKSSLTRYGEECPTLRAVLETPEPIRDVQVTDDLGGPNWR